MSLSDKAVFLSYASQDAEAAKRICEALRGAGVEVWFDQNELVGGDTWDAKIRGQIGSCALFVPVISANTQARLEGYFRLEWKIAAQRTHTMADERVFLLPVVIDATRDAEARVPAEFKSVQWTRLPGGEATPAFCTRVVKLLGAGKDAEDSPSHSAPASTAVAPSRRKAAWIGYGWAAVGIVFALVYAVRPMWEGLRAKPEKTVRASVPAETEAQRLVAKAREILDQGDEMNRENYALAEELLKRAEAADVTEASAWSLHAWLSADLYRYGLDRTEGRLAQIQSQASRAASLAPDSLDAQLAMLRLQTATRAAPEAIAKRQADLAEKFPDDPRVYRLFGLSHAKDSVTFKMLERALARWPDDPRLQGDMLNSLLLGGRYAEGLEFAERVTRGKTGARVLAAQVFLQLWWEGDPAAAVASVSRWPTWFFSEDRGAGMATVAALVNRQPEQARDILRRFPRDYIRDSFFTGPRSALAAWAHEAAGQAESAEAEWRVVVQVCDRELATNSTDAAALHWKAWALARLGDKTAARQIFRQLLQRRVSIEGLAQVAGGLGGLALVLDDPEEALRELGRLGGYDAARTRPPSRALFNVNPLFDPLRRDPRFQALLREAPAPAREPAVAAAPMADDKSVAVLAFANLSDDKNNEYFSDGISEELLNVLAKVPGLKVSARTSAFFFKGKEVPVPEIAKQLGVAYVVEGSVRKQGDKVRITAQLIKAADGFHVWSDTFTRDLKDIFAVQDEIAGLIAQNLQLKMGMVPPRPTIDLEAYQEYLAGKALFAKAGNMDLRAAIGHFEKAVAIEPKFTAAWVQLASAHTRLGRWGGTPTLKAWAAARAAIDQARLLEPDSPEMLLALGWILRTAEWDWKGAEQAFRRALQLQPNQPDALAGAAVLLFNIGQTEEAYRLARQAVQLDPLNAATQIDLSIMFYMNKNWVEAERSARRALQLAPGGTSYHSILSWGLIGQRRFAEAEAEIAQDQEGVDRTNAQGLLAIARGQEKEAREQLARLEGYSRVDGDLADLQQSIAWLCAYLGEKDRAFAALEKAAASRDPSMAWLFNSWYLEPLYSDPRWPVFLRKVGLAADQLK